MCGEKHYQPFINGENVQPRAEESIARAGAKCINNLLKSSR